MLVILKRRLERQRTLRSWVRKIYQKRKEKGDFHRLVTEAKLADEELFFKMFRMTPKKFETLLSLVFINSSEDNARRGPIGPAKRLSVTLRYLVTGDIFSTIAHSYRWSNGSVRRIVEETHNFLWKNLSEGGIYKATREYS